MGLCAVIVSYLYDISVIHINWSLKLNDSFDNRGRFISVVKPRIRDEFPFVSTEPSRFRKSQSRFAAVVALPRPSSLRRTYRKVPINMNWWSMQPRLWAPATCGWRWCCPRARTSTSGSPSTVRPQASPATCTHFFYSCGLLQPDQHALRHHHWVLHWRELPHHVGRPKIRVPLGGRPHRQETHQVFGAQIYWLSHDLGAGPARRRDSLPVENRQLW